MPSNGDIKIRVPAALKELLQVLADHRITSLSEITREALLEYVAGYGITPADLKAGPEAVKRRIQALAKPAAEQPAVRGKLDWSLVSPGHPKGKRH